MNRPPALLKPVLTATLLCASLGAAASCGSAFCPINTHWDTQGLAADDGLRLDLRYSYAKADRLRAGYRRISAEAPSGSDEELENRRTINEILNVDADYTLNARWSVAVGFPLVKRDHAHTFDSSIDGPFKQDARFTALGDIRVLGRYRLDVGSLHSGAGLRFGIKLPTGSIHKNMSPRDPADPDTPYALERASQPGTGSTDLIAGAYWYEQLPGSGWGWFASGQVQSPVATRDEFRPGNEFKLDLGTHYALSPALTGLLQLNAQMRQRDGGANANPASGGHALYLSPGLSYGISPTTQVYGAVQVALRQYAHVNPEEAGSGQLTAPWALTLGVSHRY